MRTQVCDQDDWIKREIKTGEVLIKVVKFAFKIGEYGINGIKDDEYAVKFGEVCIKKLFEYVFE